jgi:hypothetical protein
MCENDKFDVSYEIITQNLAPVTQQNKLGARQYVVAPVSMLVPGVLNGSAGALYYPLEEISKNVDSWNMMPLTLGHPNKDGMGISARSPEILENYALGFVFNARIQDKKLVADAWFDKERTSKLSPALLTKLETGEPVELSTGLYTENVPVKNKTWKDKPYNAIARNYRPDHLAILMDVKGACSLNDGCGLNVNEEQEITYNEDELKFPTELELNAEKPKGKKLNKPFRTPKGPKKFAVYVKGKSGKTVIVRFGDPNMEIKRDDPKRRKAFRDRHNCAQKKDKTTPGYWSCKMWSSSSVSSITNQNPANFADVDETCPFNRSKVIESQCPFGR